MRHSFRVILLGVALSTAATAQAPSSRWDAWIGCWQPVNGLTSSMTCALPGESPEAVQLVTFAGDSVVQRTSITADGTKRTLEVQGCTGSEVARFSEDGSQVFVNGEVRCGDGPLQATSGLIAISETGHWLDVHVVRVGEQRDLRVRRSRSVQDLATVPAGVRAELSARVRASWAARVAAARPVSLPRVTETSGAVDERVVEAWLLESSRDGSRMEPVDARGLAQLDEAKVPGRVIDAMIALSYPERFQVALSDAGAGEVSRVSEASAALGGGSGYGGAYGAAPMYGDFLAYSYGRQAMCLSYACYLYHAQRPYLYGFSGYGLGGWNGFGGWGMYPGWGYGPVTVVVRPTMPGEGGGGAPASGGRVVKGRGYTPSSGATGGTAQPRATTVTPSSSGSATTRSGSSSSSGSAEKSTTTRTAKPRKP